MIQTAASRSPLFTRLLAQRGLTETEKIEAYLHAGLDRLTDPFQMKGMQEAVERVRRAARTGEKILVHGDYDVDGVTGSALVGKTLERLEASYRIFLPDRARDGYGVSASAIQRGAADGFSLLITVDCGIAAREQVKTARALGLDVVVIDHHRIPADGLPDATVILNPLQEGCLYPFKELSAAGLAFKLSQALLGQNAYDFLDIAALSTVCDVAPLVEENRIIVREGLELLSRRVRPGLRALSEAAGIRSREMNTGHIGFMLGPRLNAAGRMSSPDIALRLLMTSHDKEAASLARALEEENKARQREERELVKQAVHDVERFVNFNRDRVIVVARRGWHAGVIGIVAARLVDKFHRPAVVIAIEADGTGKGSGRSIKKFHLFHAFEACREALAEFGGHAQAAGLVIREERVEDFRRLMNKYAARECEAGSFVRETPVDMELALGDLTATFLRELELLEPYGAGNPKPVFLTRNLEIKSKPARLGFSAHQMWVTDGSLTCEAQWSERSGVDSASFQKGSRIHLAYAVKMRVWDGVERLILEIKDSFPAAE